ncbi:MAG: YwqG family protein [Minicystis sp.]
MSTPTLTDVRAILERAMPVRGPGFELLLSGTEDDPSVFENPDGSWCMRVRLCILEDGGNIRDVKEQELFLLRPEDRTPERAPRVVAHLRGWLRALPAIGRARAHEIEMLMPHDLQMFEPLQDASLRTEDDFAKALEDPERVRRWLRESALSTLRDELSQWGLEGRAEEFEALARPAIRLGDPTRVYRPDEVEPDDDETDTEPTPVGATRIGGEPDLPPLVPWPSSGKRPMTFAAQLDLAELAQLPAARELPRDGLLSFFYNPFPETDFQSHIAYPVRVLYSPAGEMLERRATPPEGDRRPEISVAPRALANTMPPMESPFYEALLPIEKVMKFRGALAQQEPFEDPLAGLPQYAHSYSGDDDDGEERHQVLGYCHPFQGDPYVEAEVHAAGRNWDGWVEGSREAVETARRARRWRLLLQLDAMHERELLFEQDGGYLYFLIPEDALAERDWSRVWCVLQFG